MSSLFELTLTVLAARVLTHLMDLNPASIPIIVQCGAAPVLCAHLSSIEYIDVAEQSLQVIEDFKTETVPALKMDPGFAKDIFGARRNTPQCKRPWMRADVH